MLAVSPYESHMDERLFGADAGAYNPERAALRLGDGSVPGVGGLPGLAFGGGRYRRVVPILHSDGCHELVQALGDPVGKFNLAMANEMPAGRLGDWRASSCIEWLRSILHVFDGQVSRARVRGGRARRDRRAAAFHIRDAPCVQTMRIRPQGGALQHGE